MIQYEKRGYRFAINYEAIAQHYGFNTKHLDLTRSYDVAMFFATTKVIDDKYYVITEPQKGVIYTVNLKLAWQLDAKNITPIGFQPLNRPDQQYAFSVMLEENMNFNTLPFVEKKNLLSPKNYQKNISLCSMVEINYFRKILFQRLHIKFKALFHFIEKVLVDIVKKSNLIKMILYRSLSSAIMALEKQNLISLSQRLNY
jgi:hypothetical protein